MGSNELSHQPGKRYTSAPPPSDLPSGYRTSCSRPISHLNASIQDHLPISGPGHLVCTSDSCGGIALESDKGADQGLPDLHVPRQCLVKNLRDRWAYQARRVLLLYPRSYPVRRWGPPRFRLVAGPWVDGTVAMHSRSPRKKS